MDQEMGMDSERPHLRCPPGLPTYLAVLLYYAWRLEMEKAKQSKEKKREGYRNVDMYEYMFLSIGDYGG